jgi:hypothetical protein
MISSNRGHSKNFKGSAEPHGWQQSEQGLKWIHNSGKINQTSRNHYRGFVELWRRLCLPFEASRWKAISFCLFIFFPFCSGRGSISLFNDLSDIIDEIGLPCQDILKDWVSMGHLWIDDRAHRYISFLQHFCEFITNCGGNTLISATMEQGNLREILQ